MNAPDALPAMATVLLVDDEPRSIDAMRRTLDEDFEVLSATGADAARAWLQRRPVDVILCDQRMPGTTGVQFLKEVRERWPDSVRIIISGYTDSEDIVAGINEAGIHQYLLKPWAPDHLLRTVHEAAAVPIGFGGDHGVLLAELRAAAATHGTVALIQFDAHSDTWEDYFGEKYTHSTVVRRATEEGLVDPARSTLLGMRGGLYGPGDLEGARDLGFTVIPWDDLAQLGTAAVAAAVERAGGKAFLTFDIDFVDPAFAPGTGTPECGGPTSMQALALLRACRGLQIVGADVVEVLPDLDSSHLTSTLAATVAWEILSLLALTTADGTA